MTQESLEELIEEQRHQEALAVAIDRYREKPTDSLCEQILHLRSTASRTLWCSPKMSLCGDVGSLAVRRDGTQAAVGCSFSDAALLLRDLVSGEVVWISPDIDEAAISALAYSPAGDKLAILTARDDRMIYQFDLASRECARIASPGAGPDLSGLLTIELSYSISGSLIAMGAYERPVRCFQVDRDGHFALPGTFLAFDGSGRVICRADNGALIEVDLDSSEIVRTSGPVGDVSMRGQDFAYGGDHFVYPIDRTESRKVILRNLATGDERQLESDHCYFSTALSANGEWIAWSGVDEFSCRNVVTGEQASYLCDLGSEGLLEFASTRGLVVAGTRVRTPRLIPLPSAEGESEPGDSSPSFPGDQLPLHGHTSGVTRVGFSEDASRVISQSDDRTVHSGIGKPAGNSRVSSSDVSFLSMWVETTSTPQTGSPVGICRSVSRSPIRRCGSGRRASLRRSWVARRRANRNRIGQQEASSRCATCPMSMACC